MRLRDFIDEKQVVKRECLIGKEFDVMEQKALLLGIQTRHEEEDGIWDDATKLYVIYEESWDEDEWDDEEDWNEEFDEPQTNRQVLIDRMDLEIEPGIMEISSFMINGQEFEVMGAENFDFGEKPYDLAVIVKRAAQQGKIPPQWLDQELELLSIAAFDVEDTMFDIAWDVDILGVDVKLEPMAEEVLVGKTFTCKCERPDVPREIFVKDQFGNDVPVKIYGLVLYNLWEMMDETDIAQLDPEELLEMQAYCRKDERLLAIEYSTDDDLQMNFYRKDYLDALADEEEVIGYPGIGILENRRNCILGVVPQDFDEAVEVELLSYTVFHDEILAF